MAKKKAKSRQRSTVRRAKPTAIPELPSSDDTSRRATAFHEAGHAAADLVFEHSPSIVTIKESGSWLGHAAQIDGDRYSVEGERKLVISLYAGAEAQSRVCQDVERIRRGATSDDEQAEEYLSKYPLAEADLRAETKSFVTEHWELVKLIASELLKETTLFDIELDKIYGIFRNEVPYENLIQYRMTAADELARLKSGGSGG